MRASGAHIKNVRAVIADRLFLAGFAQRRRASGVFMKPRVAHPQIPKTQTNPGSNDPGKERLDLEESAF